RSLATTLAIALTREATPAAFSNSCGPGSEVCIGRAERWRAPASGVSRDLEAPLLKEEDDSIKRIAEAIGLGEARVHQMTAALLQDPQEVGWIVLIHLHHPFKKRTTFQQVSHAPKQGDRMVGADQSLSRPGRAARESIGELEYADSSLAQPLQHHLEDRLAAPRRDVLEDDQGVEQVEVAGNSRE